MEENSVVHLVAKHRRDGENESMHSREEKNLCYSFEKTSKHGGYGWVKISSQKQAPKVS